jgi:hypothetical protein
MLERSVIAGYLSWRRAQIEELRLIVAIVVTGGWRAIVGGEGRICAHL